MEEDIEHMTEGALRHHLQAANARNVELVAQVEGLIARNKKLKSQNEALKTAFTSLCDVLKMYGLGEVP